jgi:hypothetical protein
MAHVFVELDAIKLHAVELRAVELHVANFTQ